MLTPRCTRALIAKYAKYLVCHLRPHWYLSVKDKSFCEWRKTCKDGIVCRMQAFAFEKLTAMQTWFVCVTLRLWALYCWGCLRNLWRQSQHFTEFIAFDETADEMSRSSFTHIGLLQWHLDLDWFSKSLTDVGRQMGYRYIQNNWKCSTCIG